MKVKKNNQLIFLILTSFFAYLMMFFQVELVFASDYWDQNVYNCQSTSTYPFTGNPFPAKMDSGNCSDGDSVLFNGILCASGDQRGCDTVKRSQTADGRFWRSPRRAQTNNLGQGDSNIDDLSFSDDQNLGVLLYVVTKNDTDALNSWMKWLDDNRPKHVGLLNQPGLPRYCLPQGKDNCTLQPIYRDMIWEVATYYKLAIPDSIQNYHQSITQATFPLGDILNYLLSILAIPPEYIAGGLTGDNYIDSPVTSKLATQAKFEVGFALHLDAVRALILKKIGKTDPALTNAISNITTREPNNAFFQYVNEGATQKVADLVVKYCPSYAHPVKDLNERIDYLWEQKNSAQWTVPFAHLDDDKCQTNCTRSVRTMLWDCIMMRNLSPTLYPKP